MTYLRSFGHDVFVSYGHGPKPFSGFAGERNDFVSNWTRRFADDLSGQLDVLLGTKDPDRRVKIWMDPELDGNKPLSQNLTGIIQDSALLLVVMSNFYLDSKWCGSELDWFGQQSKITEPDRIFVVRAFNTDTAKWPALLKPDGSALPGYPFFTASDGKSLGNPLGWPQPDPSDKDYWKQLPLLAEAIASKLNRLKYLEDQPAAMNPANVPGRVGRTVFLGYMHDSLLDLRADLRARLVQANLQVLPPELDDPIDEPSLRASFEKYSSQCSAIVLVANEYSEQWPKRQVGGPVNFQLQSALERKLTVHFWLKADIANVKNPSYRDFLTDLKAKAAQDPALLIDPKNVDEFVDYICNKLDNVEKREPGAEQFAVVCSNLKPGQAQYEDFQSLVLDTIADTERASIIADGDEKGLIRLTTLQEDIARADTLVVLCFDQDWDWANRIIQQLKQIVGGRSEKIKIFVTGPEYKNRGRYYNAFRFQTVMGVGPDNIVQRDKIQDQIRTAIKNINLVRAS